MDNLFKGLNYRITAEIAKYKIKNQKNIHTLMIYIIYQNILNLKLRRNFDLWKEYNNFSKKMTLVGELSLVNNLLSTENNKLKGNLAESNTNLANVKTELANKEYLLLQFKKTLWSSR